MLRRQWEGIYSNDSLRCAQFLPSSQSPQQSSALQLQEAKDALQQLLSMRFPRFLSHFMHNESLAEFLDTFLLYRDRYYVHRQPTEFDELLPQLDRDVVLVFLRVVGDEFSSLAVEGAKDQEQVRKEYGELISRSKLLTLPRILDVCTLCGENNTSVVSRFLNAVISLLPRFREDFENMAVELLSTAEQMREALNNTATTDDAVPLDLLQYSTDIACSMCVLLEALQADLAKTGLIASQKCLASAGTELLRALGIIYEEVIPLCQSALTRLNREQHTTEAGTFAQTRLLRAARAVVMGANNAPTGGLAPQVDQPAAPWSGVVFELMEVSLSSVEICSSSYLKPGSFSGDLYTVCQTELTQLIRETAPDSTSADYAISALQEQPRYLTASRGAGDSGSATAAPAAAAAAAAVPAAEPVSPVEAVKMILPDLGEGFIQACLAAFNYNPDEVVARVLEDNLPPKLAAMDRKAGQIWVGKRDNDERDQAFKAKQRERMRAMEREQEMHEHLKGRFEREYDDDYDDQYDDMVGVPVGGGALLDQDLVRKYNALVRAEESEMKYFEDIKVQNRPKKSDSQSSGEESEEAGEGPAAEGDAAAAAARPGSAKATAGLAPGGEKPELTKWQKRRKEVRGSHHRKDRAARKYGKGLV